METWIIILLAVAALFLIGFCVFKLNSSTTTKEKTSEKLFLNTTEKIFPANTGNNAMLMELTNDKTQSWAKVPAGQGKFILVTVIGGKKYSLQDGAPGTSAKWGLAFVAPTGQGRISKDVVLRTDASGQLVAASSEPWPGLSKLVSDNGILRWGSATQKGITEEVLM